MARKILILNGSPRIKGNTAILCDSFAKGAESAGHSVTRFDLQKMNIKGCIGCMKGGKDPLSPCVQKDDMDKIYPVFIDADIIVMASPMYWWNVTSQLKAVIDRLFAVAESNPEETLPVKDSVFIMAAGDDTQENWKPALDYYESASRLLRWRDRGRILAGKVLAAGDVAGKEIVADAFNLGSSL